MQKTKMNSLLIIIYLFTPGLTILPYSMINHEIKYSFETILYITVLIISILINWKQLNKNFFVIFILLNTLFLLNLIFVDYHRIVMKNYFIFFYSAIGILYLISQKIDWKYLIQSWYVIAIVNIFIWLSLLDEVADREISYMNLGTSLTFSFIIIFYRFYLKRKWYDLILLSIVFGLIAVYGNRGALLATVLMVAIFIVYKTKHKITIISIGLIITIFMLAIDIKKVLINGIENLILFSSGANINTLTLRRTLVFLEDGFEEGSTGRNLLFDKAIEIIKDGFMPRGVGYYEKMSEYIYPHNIFLDLFIIFGYLSIPILIVAVIGIIYYFYKETYNIRKDIVLMLLAVSFTRLLLSSTLLHEISLWLVIGLMLFYKSESSDEKLNHL